MSKKILLSLVAIAWLPTLAGADGAVPVSPGAADRFLGTASACPTFSWSGVEGAEGYELIVYAMPYEEGAAAAVPEWPAVEEGPAIRAVARAGSSYQEERDPPPVPCPPAGRLVPACPAGIRATGPSATFES